MNNLVSQTIRSQLSINTLMSCGARGFVGTHNSLLFQVGNTRSKNFIHIILSSDLYKVEFLKINKKTLKMETLESAKDIYCDILNKTIYNMVNK